MASRNRPRAGQLKDEIDPASLWLQIRNDAKEIDRLMAESNDVNKKFKELQAQQEARTTAGKSPSDKLDAEMETCLREQLRLTEEISSLDITDRLEILEALRSSNEAETIPTSRATSVGKSQRERPNKRKTTEALDDQDSIAADSPAPNPIANPSPKVVISHQKDRLIAKTGSSRAGSVPMGRESSVKAEDDKDDLVKDVRPRLTPGTEVLYRPPKRSLEGEGILCRVTSVIGEGKQRRYEIIDSDPDPPTPSLPYRASVNHLVPIPPPGTDISGKGGKDGLGELGLGKNVLALYPGTTTFYKAEVVREWKGGRKGEEGEGMVRLRFEGEDEADREMSVERRYVLPDK